MSASFSIRKRSASVITAFATMAMAMVVLTFFTNWSIYQYVVLAGIPPLVYYFATIALAIVILIVRPVSLSILFRERLFIWFVLYALTGLIWVVTAGNMDPENSDWRLRWLLLLLFSAGILLCSWVDFRQLAKVILVTMVFAIITYWHDFLTPFFYVPAGTPFSNPGRGAGLFINANQAGTALVVMGIIAMPFVSKRWHALILLVVLLGVVPTFSRSAILFALIAAGVWIWHERSQRWNVVFILVGLPLIISLGVQLFDIGIASREINTSNVTDRVAFFTNFGGAADSSADERQYVAALSWQKFTEHPLTGLGVGVTDALSNDWGYHQSTHNMFLRLMVEQGILGGAMYLVFLMLIFARGRGLIKNASTAVEKNIGIALILMALNFTFIGLFSHTLLQEPSTIISLALLLAAAHRVEAGSLRNGHGPMHAHIPTLRG